MVQVEIDPESKLEIHGTTNINSFACIQEDELQEEALQVEVLSSDQKWMLNNANLGVPLVKFDCGIQQMTNDFHETLKSREYPYIKMKINSIVPTSNSEEFLANVTIDLAGEQNSYLIPVEVEDFNGKIHCLGEKFIDFEDFNLAPPVKFMGLVRVHDQIQIRFNLILRAS